MNSGKPVLTARREHERRLTIHMKSGPDRPLKVAAVPFIRLTSRGCFKGNRIKSEAHLKSPMNEQIPVAAIEPQNRNLLLGFGFLPRLRSSAWWTMSWQCVRELQKFVLKPAAALGFALTAPYIAFDIGYAVMRSHTGAYNGLADTLSTIAVPILLHLVLGLASLAAACWGLGACVVGSTALCKTFLSIEAETISADPQGFKTTISAILAESVAEFKQRKAFLFSAWAMYLVFIAAPTMIMIVSTGVLIIGMPKIGDYSLMPIQLNVPPEIMIAAGIALTISLIAISNYTLILMPYTSISKLSGTKVAVSGLLLSMRVFAGITLYSIIVFLLSNILIAPVDLLVLFNGHLGNNVFMRYFLFTLKALWHALFFALLMPITMLIPCEMIRGNIK